jgi:radical SAM superfamily enzyme YgiQ (UPF0313 family)
VTVYAQRCREAFPDVAVVIGSIEASLRRIAHYDYWSDKVRRSVLPDSKADLLIFGNAERALVELAHRLAAARRSSDIRDLRGTAFMVPAAGCPETGRNRFDRGRYAGAAGQACRSVCDGDEPAKKRRERRPPMAIQHVVRLVGREPNAGRARARAHRRSACRPTSRSRTTRCSTPTPRAPSTSNPTPAMRARWCRRTASATSG